MESFISKFAEVLVKYVTDVPAVVMLLGLVVFILVLVRWHKADDRFDLRHVLLDGQTDRVSLGRLGQLTALFASTSVLYYQVAHGLLSEWLFTGYMLTWAGANVANNYVNKKAAQPAQPPEG